MLVNDQGNSTTIRKPTRWSELHSRPVSSMVQFCGSMEKQHNFMCFHFSSDWVNVLSRINQQAFVLHTFKISVAHTADFLNSRDEAWKWSGFLALELYTWKKLVKSGMELRRFYRGALDKCTLGSRSDLPRSRALWQKVNWLIRAISQLGTFLWNCPLVRSWATTVSRCRTYSKKN